MIRLKWSFLLFLILPLMAGCALPNAAMDRNKSAPALPAGTLGGTEVRALFFNQTVKSQNSSGAVSLTYYAPNGILQQKRDDQFRSGAWMVKSDGRICLTMTGEERKCRFILKENNQYIKYTVKKKGRIKPLVTYLSFQPGNRLGP